MDYIIDVKVYNSVPPQELGIALPVELLRHGNIPVGVHQIIILDITEEYLDQLQEKTFEHPDVKILGIHRVELSENI